MTRSSSFFGQWDDGRRPGQQEPADSAARGAGPDPRSGAAVEAGPGPTSQEDGPRGDRGLLHARSPSLPGMRRSGPRDPAASHGPARRPARRAGDDAPAAVQLLRVGIVCVDGAEGERLRRELARQDGVAPGRSGEGEAAVWLCAAHSPHEAVALLDRLGDAPRAVLLDIVGAVGAAARLPEERRGGAAGRAGSARGAVP